MLLPPIDDPSHERAPGSAHLELGVRAEGPITITARGEIDASNCGALRRLVSAAVATRAAEVVVDLTAVTYLDSTTLAVLALGQRHATEHGTAFGVRASAEARRLLEITGMTDLMDPAPPLLDDR